MNIVVASYGAALLAFAVLLVLVLTSWRNTGSGRRVVLACIAMVVWSAIMVATGLLPWVWFPVIYYAELLRNAALAWVLFGVAGSVIPIWFRRATLVAFALFALVGMVGIDSAQFGLDDLSANVLLARAGLLFAFLGLVALEQTYRNARGQARAALRYFILGLGVIYAFDLFLYSQVELFRYILADAWVARGVVDALAAPMIAIAIRRNPEWSIDIFVSRQVVFYTSAFLAVGAYLVFVAVGGYYVRLVGGSWGGIAEIMFLSGSVVVLAGTLFSQAMRRRLMVFIAKHFFRNKYDYRIEWLRFVQTLSERGDDSVPGTALRAIAQTMGSPYGALFTLDDRGQRFVARAVWPTAAIEIGSIPDVDADEEFVRMLEDRQWIVDTRERRIAPDAYQNLVLPDWIESNRGYRIVSPILELNRLTGIVLLADTDPPIDLTFEDRDLLKTLGRHVATYLAQHEASRKLAESQQFETYNRLTAFMMHDLKNSVAQLKLIVANAQRYKHNPEFIDDTIATIDNTAERMTRLIAQLRGDAASASLRPVDLGAITAAACKRCSDRTPVPQLSPLEGVCTVAAEHERLTGVIEHVIRNAQDATLGEGTIAVSIAMTDDTAKLTVTDSGQGMDPQFVRERLFRPFDSTKGSKGMGIGAYQVKEYVRSLGGDVEVSSSPGEGTMFTLSFKRLPDANLQQSIPPQGNRA